MFSFLFPKNNYKVVPNNNQFPEHWKTLLHQHVEFYSLLPSDLKALFETRILEFLLNFKIKGVQTDVTLLDKLLVASSATIPTYKIQNWRYTTLTEVVLYPSSFTTHFHYDNKEKGQKLNGMIGNGALEGKMFLSKKALHLGFQFANDKVNVGIHEFIHLVDKEDGKIDGIPLVLLQNAYVLPWLKLIKNKTQEITQNQSDINSYAAVNQQEFFTVAAEYFFEDPELLKIKHPVLYNAMASIFNQNPAQWWVNKKRNIIQNHEDCPCGSGQKFINCCGDIHSF